MKPDTGPFDDPKTPPASLVLGYGPMLLIALAGLLAWTLPQPWPLSVTWLAIDWSAIILIFLAGARRGLSFHTPGGAELRDLLEMMGLFMLGAAATVVATPIAALSLLIVGYASVGVLDRAAALRGQAPAFFASLRPRQAVIAVAGLLALLLFRLLRA